jgi:hypothetical protein
VAGKNLDIDVKRIFLWTTCLAFVSLILFGITGSSIGTNMLDSNEIGTQTTDPYLGSPKDIRSDEFLRVTPWRYGLMQEASGEFAPTLSAEPSPIVINFNDGIVTKFVYADTSLALFLGNLNPDLGVSFLWWISFALSLILFPAWGRIVGIPFRISVLGILLIALSPITAWWSLGPINVLVWALIAAVSASKFMAHQGSYLASVAYCLIASLSLTRLTFSYFPWALPVALAFVIPVFVSLVNRKMNKFQLIKLGFVFTSSLFVVAVFVYEQGTALQILSSTSYPGDRRSNGLSVGLGQLFGAPHLGYLQTLPQVLGSNLSELSTSYTILALPVLYSVARNYGTKSHFESIYFKTQTLVFVALLSWVIIDWPLKSQEFFPLNLIPPARLVAIIGFQAILLYISALLVEYRSNVPWDRFGTAIAMAIFFLVLVHAGNILKATALPGLSLESIWKIGLIFTVSAFLPLIYNKHYLSMVPLLIFVFVSTFKVNPVQIGSADLVDSGFARQIIKVNSELEDGGKWASDSITVDSYLMANAIPAQSGQQWIGPDVDEWALVDPMNKYEQEWNRGQAYLSFRWDENAAEVAVSNPSPDQILISVNPCDPVVESLDIKRLVSGRQLESPCLQFLDSHSMGGIEWFIYGKNK